jgi:hypothetical protein
VFIGVLLEGEILSEINRGGPVLESQSEVGHVGGGYGRNTNGVDGLGT